MAELLRSFMSQHVRHAVGETNAIVCEHRRGYGSLLDGLMAAA